MQSFISAPLLRLTKPKRLGVDRRRARARHTATAGGGHAKLLSAERLKEWLRTDPDVIILDVRGRVVKVGGRVESGLQQVEYVADDNAYFGGHIPGARFIDWRKVDIADHARLCDLCADCGVERAKPVVAYDWGDSLFATRLWYALVCMGCADVAVLNGGWGSWDRCNGPVSLDTQCPLKSYSEFDTLLAPAETPRGTVTFAEMRKLVAAPQGVTVIDARSSRQYSGVERRGARGGHIAGAISIPYRALLRENGGLLPDDEIRGVLETAGVDVDADGSGEFVAYCNGGVASTVVLFCLARCGVPTGRLRNYCGSFSEWGSAEGAAVVDGSAL